jgi:hypothetical protein
VTTLPVPGWLPGSVSSGFWVPDIFFYLRIEILTLTNQYIDIHENIPPYLYPGHYQPPGSASNGLQVPNI